MALNFKKYITFWWRKPAKEINGEYDQIKYITSSNSNLIYKLVSRTGIAFRFSYKHDWNFVGYLKMSKGN